MTSVQDLAQNLSELKAESEGQPLEDLFLTQLHPKLREAFAPWQLNTSLDVLLFIRKVQLISTVIIYKRSIYAPASLLPLPWAWSWFAPRHPCGPVVRVDWSECWLMES